MFLYERYSYRQGVLGACPSRKFFDSEIEFKANLRYMDDSGMIHVVS